MPNNLNKESKSCLHLSRKENLKNVSTFSQADVLNDEICENEVSFLLAQTGSQERSGYILMTVNKSTISALKGKLNSDPSKISKIV